MAFFGALRRHAWLQNSWFVFVCERNTGRESGHIANCVLRNNIGRTMCVRMKEGRDYGVWTSFTMKSGYAAAGRARINDRSVRFMAEHVCTNPFARSSATAKDIRDASREELFKQLSTVREVATSPVSAFQQQKFSVSGKVGEDGKIVRGQNDDLAMVFMMACYYVSMLLERRIPFLDYNLLERG
jgi:hypothetical protein